MKYKNVVGYANIVKVIKIIVQNAKLVKIDLIVYHIVIVNKDIMTMKKLPLIAINVSHNV